MMRQRVALLCVVLVAVVVVARTRISDHMYSVSEVLAGLRSHPVAWSGRTVLVRGLTSGWVSSSCPGGISISCPTTNIVLLADTSTSATLSGSLAAMRGVGWAPAAMLAAASGRLPSGKIVTYAFPGPINARPLALVLLKAQSPAVVSRLLSPSPPWPYTLPIIGPILWNARPPSAAVIVRVRLSRGLPCLGPVCADGVLMQ